MVLKPLAFLSLIRMPASLTSLKGSRSRICFQTSPFVKKVFQKGFTLQHSNFLSYFDPIGLNHLSFILAHRIVKFCNPSALQSPIQIPICRWCESIPKVWRMGRGSRWWCLFDVDAGNAIVVMAGAPTGPPQPRPRALAVPHRSHPPSPLLRLARHDVSAVHQMASIKQERCAGVFLMGHPNARWAACDPMGKPLCVQSWFDGDIPPLSNNG
jgi:hypothetical protein